MTWNHSSLCVVPLCVLTSRQPGAWDETWQREYFDSRFEPARGHVIEVDGRIAGYLEVERSSDRIFLAIIELAPEFQELKIGTRIVENLIQEASTLGVAIFLQVLRANPRAKDLYQRVGFIEYDQSDTHIKMVRR